MFDRLLLSVCLTTAMTAPAMAAPSKEGRYLLAQNRLYLATGDYRKAVDILQQLEQRGENKGKEYALAVLATCRVAPCQEKAREAASYLQRNYGRDRDVSKELTDFRRSRQPGGEITVYALEGGSSRTDTGLKAEASVPLGDVVTLGISSTVVQTELESIPDPDSGRFRSVERTAGRSELYVQAPVGQAIIARGQLFANKDTLGAGAQMVRKDFTGALQLVAAWREPYWGFNELLAADGTRSRLYARRVQRLGSDWTAELGAGGNSYHIESDELARSASVNAAVGYALPADTALRRLMGSGSDAGLRYAVDAEYAGKRMQRTGSSGQLFRPLPLDSREVHSLSASAGKTWQNGTAVSGYAGYAYDRLAGNGGPLAGGSLRYTHHDGWQVAAELDQSLDTSNTSDVYRYVGIRVGRLY